LDGDKKDSVKIERQVTARIPTKTGEFQLFLYTSDRDDKEQLALVLGDVQGKTGVLVRVHSECFTGDVLGSLRCDCGEQLDRAIQMIAQKGEGVLVYLRQEGRGIGLLDKLRAYNLQDQGYDTVEANLALGHQADEREYSLAARILDDLGVASVELLTNNPQKIQHLNRLGIPVTRRVPLEPTVTADNAIYLSTKVQRMNHILHLDRLAELEKPNGNGSKNGAH
jgi:3,4-dihydroxy 2-butanone 4-phosphate synthase/GTP cyclohydrolase II